MIIYAHGEGQTSISVLDPEAALGVFGNDAIKPIAREERERLEGALASLVGTTS